MDGVTIHYKVDLVIFLIDTTTGRPVTGAGTVLTKNGSDFSLQRRGDGIFVAINVGREDFTLGIKANGYEYTEIDLRYESLDERLPIQTVFLIPKENSAAIQGILSLKGSLEGIEALEGICLGKSVCAASEFDSKKNILTVFKPSGTLSLEGIFYGLLKGEESYEKFEILEKTGESQVKLKEALKEEFSINSPIARIVFGSVKGDEYLFRVQDDATDLRYLISYVVKGEQRFRLIDFHQSEEIRLD